MPRKVSVISLRNSYFDLNFDKAMLLTLTAMQTFMTLEHLFHVPSRLYYIDVSFSKCVREQIPLVLHWINPSI